MILRDVSSDRMLVTSVANHADADLALLALSAGHDSRVVAICIKIDEFRIKNDKFCSKNDEFCI